MGFTHPDLKQIIEECSDPKWAVFVAMWDRVGLKGWMTNLEYVYFRPDTPANLDFYLTIMQWPEHERMYWAIVRIPREQQGVAHALLWQHGLKVAGSRDPEGGPYVPIMIDSKGIHRFPFAGEHIFFLENHSQGAKNVAYTNDPDKIKAAEAHEDTIIQKFHDEHEAWLSVPENYAAAEAFWESRPDLYPPEKKPPKRF